MEDFKPAVSNAIESPINQDVSSDHQLPSSPSSIPNRTGNADESTLTVEGYFNTFPAGYRFQPRNDELIRHYLMRKINNESLPPNKIHDVNLYRYNPQTLTEQYTTYGEKEWYFLTPRNRKYPNGQRPNRAAGDGYWKATGADKTIKFNGVTVGFRKVLVFYTGKPPKGDKTTWIMHEYRVDNPPSPRSKRVGDNMRLDDWVLCRIYKKDDKPIVRHRHQDDETNDNREHISAEEPGVAAEVRSAALNENVQPAEMNSDYNGNVESVSPFFNSYYNYPLHQHHQNGFAEGRQFHSFLLCHHQAAMKSEVFNQDPWNGMPRGNDEDHLWNQYNLQSQSDLNNEQYFASFDSILPYDSMEQPQHPPNPEDDSMEQPQHPPNPEDDSMEQPQHPPNLDDDAMEQLQHPPNPDDNSIEDAD